MTEKQIKHRYEKLIEKAERCTIASSKAETAWAEWYWQNVADHLIDQALHLPLCEA